MQLPRIRGVIDRRILVNYRVDPEQLAKFLPEPFRPQTVGEYGIAGICLIRLKQIRPAWLPAWVGIGSENAAHRIAVEWDTEQGTQTGVYVPRRDTSSRLNSFVGGRIFPGVQHHARFAVSETEQCFRVEINHPGHTSHVLVEGELSESLPADSIFSSIRDVSDFFEQGSLGYSPASMAGKYDGLELRAENWKVQPLSVSRVESSFFSNREFFPVGSVSFDNALLMQDIHHEWHSREPICCSPMVSP